MNMKTNKAIKAWFNHAFILSVPSKSDQQKIFKNPVDVIAYKSYNSNRNKEK